MPLTQAQKNDAMAKHWHETPEYIPSSELSKLPIAKLTAAVGFGCRFEDIGDRGQLTDALSTLSQCLRDLKKHLAYLERKSEHDPNRTHERKLFALEKYVRTHAYFKKIITTGTNKSDAKAKDLKTETWHDPSFFDEALDKLEQGSKVWMDDKESTVSPGELEYLLDRLNDQWRVRESPVVRGK